MAYRRRTRRFRRKRMVRRRRTARPGRAMKGGLLRSFTFRRYGDVTGGLTLTSGGNSSAITMTSDGLVLNSGSAGTSNITYYSYSYYFTLSSLPGYSEVTNLFDQYKIRSIQLRFIPFQNGSIADPTSANQCLSLLHFGVIDYDDNTIFGANNTGVQSLREYESFREMNMFKNREFRRKIRPHISVPAYQNAMTTAYTNVPSRWIDCNYSDVEHYGFKGIFQAFAPITTSSYFIWLRPEIRVTLSGRAVR